MLESKQRVVILHIFYLVLWSANSIFAESSTHEHGFYLGERDGKSDQDVTWSFESNLNKFKKIGVVDEFMKFHKNGLLAKDKVFNMRDPAIRAETISIIDLLFFSEDSGTMNTLVRWLYPQMNFEQFTYAQAVAKVHRQDGKNSFVLPNWYNIFPNYFIPSHIIAEMKTQVEKGIYETDHPPLVVPEESDGPASYFTRDVGLSNMFYNWNIYFPDWMDPLKYNCSIWKRRGEIFFDFHQQLYAHYHMRTINGSTIWEFDFKDNVKPGYSTVLRNSVGQVLASRGPDASSDYSNEAREIKRIVRLMMDIIANSTIQMNSTYEMKIREDDPEMVSILANLVYNTTESLNPSLYQSYYSAAIEYLATIGSNPDKDGGGIAKYPMSALSDPAFYPMLMRVNEAMMAYKYNKMKNYEIPLEEADFKFESFSSDRLETFFEPYDVDVSSAVDSSSKPNKYIVRQLRLSHKPFTLKYNISNGQSEKRKALVTTFLLLDIFDDKIKYIGAEGIFQVMYRFAVQLEPGINVIEKSFNTSPVYVNEDENMTQCGIPSRLALPKGSAEGQKMTLAAVVTPHEGPLEELSLPGSIRSPLCGGLEYNYDRPLMFPFDIKASGNNMKREMLGVYNATIYHTAMTFGPGITI